jgi:hypothetical protein
MKTCLVGVMCVGMFLLPSASSAQDDLSGRWGAAETTLISEAWPSPFSSAARRFVITQTRDALSWDTADGSQQTIRFNEPSVVTMRTYNARWVGRALLLDTRATSAPGEVLTFAQVLFRNGNDELEIHSFMPTAGSAEGTKVSRLVYYRRK